MKWRVKLPDDFNPFALVGLNRCTIIVIGSKFFFTFKLLQCLSEESEIYWLMILFIFQSKQGVALIIQVQLNTATINYNKDWGGWITQIHIVWLFSKKNTHIVVSTLTFTLKLLVGTDAFDRTNRFNTYEQQHAKCHLFFMNMLWICYKVWCMPDVCFFVVFFLIKSRNLLLCFIDFNLFFLRQNSKEWK